jgi:4-hydroxybenzoate polyprenyltransferase
VSDGPGRPHTPPVRVLFGLVRATHPLPALAVTILVSVVAASRGARGLSLSLIFLSTAAGQASVGWSNDYLDRERDRVTGRTEKPLVAGDVGERAVLVGALIAFPMSVGLSLPLGLDTSVVMLVAVGWAWLYNAILKTTWRSWVPYAFSFGLVPVYIWLVTGDTLPPAWIIVGSALLGVSAHLLNVIPDLQADRRTAVMGLPHRLGLRRSLLLACALLGAVLILVLVATAPPVVPQVVVAAIAAGLIVTVAWAGLVGRGRLGFRLTIASAGAIVAVFLLSPAASRL